MTHSMLPIFLSGFRVFWESKWVLWWKWRKWPEDLYNGAVNDI